MRLIRHAEASARAAASLFAEAESTFRAQSVGNACATSNAADSGAPSKSAARRARRKANKNKSPTPMESTPVAATGIGNSSAVGSASGRILQAKTSRERSPRRDTVSVVGTGSTMCTFNTGDAVVAVDLTAQPALNGTVGKVTGYDTASQGYVVRFASADAPVKLKAFNLRKP